ncbi:MAG: ABC transporter permease [Clostridia bacterium]|nr:ABC transporter permease [Clostridia bacterium]
MNFDEKKYNAQFEQYMNIPDEKFQLAHKDEKLGEKKLQTKPVGFFRDAMGRFAKNKGSVICGFILLILALYAIIAPIVSPYSATAYDGYYSYALPKNSLCVNLGLGFWDGTSKQSMNQQTYDYYSAIPGAVTEVISEYEQTDAGKTVKMYDVKIDSYAKVGFATQLLTAAEFEQAMAWQEESGHQLFYPVIDEKKIKNRAYKNNPNVWYSHNPKGVADRDENGNFIDIYKRDKEGNVQMYVSKMKGAQYQCRVLYSEWYYYQHGVYPSFLFGADNFGYDIFSRLALGARLSLILSISVASISLVIGIVIGALEGYYGGWFDLLFERIKEILWEIPTVVFMSLFQIYLASKVGPIVTLFFCFIFFNWIGTSSTVRAQFYRFKGQEYVLAARTLGAKDSRIIFKHILPNAAGFIITTSVLSIPGVIFTEANMTYLGIVNLQSSTLTSVGTMLNNAQSALSTYPHAIFFPAAFIAILLICFNIFGNGLRDAFNPSLRGAED